MSSIFEKQREYEALLLNLIRISKDKNRKHLLTEQMISTINHITAGIKKEDNITKVNLKAGTIKDRKLEQKESYDRLPEGLEKQQRRENFVITPYRDSDQYVDEYTVISFRTENNLSVVSPKEKEPVKISTEDLKSFAETYERWERTGKLAEKPKQESEGYTHDFHADIEPEDLEPNNKGKNKGKGPGR